MSKQNISALDTDYEDLDEEGNDDLEAAGFGVAEDEAGGSVEDSADTGGDDGEETDDKEDEMGGQEAEEDACVISRAKAALIAGLIANIQENTERLVQLTAGFVGRQLEKKIAAGQLADENFKPDEEEQSGRVIEGVFDGENMIGPDGKQYSVPANYASKSKLVEGDIMKLTITDNGTFIYKQIGPIDRSRVVGVLEKTPDGNFTVTADSKRWRVLTASVTYFRGGAGDEAVILVPKNGDSNWGAVENIIRQTGQL